VRVSADAISATVNGRQVGEGQLVSVDGDRGLVSLGRRPTQPAEHDDSHLVRLLQWRTARTPDSGAARGEA
jgi:hypothetical protein